MVAIKGSYQFPQEMKERLGVYEILNTTNRISR
jgi:hypothetical protein